MIDWDDYRIFQRVLYRRSYALAGAELGLAAATVRGSVQRLARRVGAALFLHAPEGLIPTAAAHDLGLVAEDMADVAGAFARLASGPLDGMEGRVRVTVRFEELLAFELLLPVFRDLQRQWPLLILELDLGVDWRRFKAGAGDIAVRLRLPDEADRDLVVRHAVAVRQGAYATKAYLAEMESDRSPDVDRRAPPFRTVEPINPIRYEDTTSTTKLPHEVFDKAFACDDRTAQLIAVQAGMGVAACSDLIARKDPTLVPVLPELTVEDDLWVVMCQANLRVRRFVAVRDAIVEHLSRHNVKPKTET